MSNDHPPEDDGLFPPLPEVLERVRETLPPETDPYAMLIESQCGTTDDSQPVEQYDGSLGVSTAFVNAHEQPVGQLQWNDNLAEIYNNPGNVAGVRWCTGALISDNLFLCAGHCFDQTGGGWTRPMIDGTNDVIPSSEIATNMHINFNYQVDPNGNLQDETQVAVVELLEYRLGGLDFAIVRLAGTPSQEFGIGEIAPRDANEGDMLAIIGHPAGVPKRIEAGSLTTLSGDRIFYDDIDTLGGNSGSAMWQSPSGRIVGVHTNGGCTTGGSGANSGMRIGRLLDESPTLQGIIASSIPPTLEGTYTIQQKSNNRYVDAHEHSGEDFRLVTRSAQNNDTQRWVLTPVGGLYTIQQKSNNRYVDAHEHSGEDFRLVTRTAQNNDTQRWVLLPTLGFLSTYTIQQLSSGRYMDAWEASSNDFSVVTRTAQSNDTQRWILSLLEDETYTLQQQKNGRFVDAHEVSSQDFRLVTRTEQDNDTQRWVLHPVGRVYTIQQLSSGRFVDAHEHAGQDFRLVTRTAQHNDTQLWVAIFLGNDTYTLQQLSSGRFVDAHEHSGQDFRLVTRSEQNNETQRWVIHPA
ncbi:MAG: RICIN domain-containing protein [Nitrococcus sp.]|nr:RICIN domain-containing protein [Nitrococcus sp.]